MNALQAKTQKWSVQKWFLVIVALGVAQFLFLASISGRARRQAHVGQPDQGQLRLSTFSPICSPSAGAGDYEDPTHLALVSARGFSGSVWLGMPRLEQRRSYWTEPPRWLLAGQGRLSARFDEASGDPGVENPIVATCPLLARPDARPTSASVTNSVLRLEGRLGRRDLLNPPVLPVWEFNDVLRPTSVQVLLDERGRVLNATLVSGSGLAGADQRALEVARGMLFRPAGDAEEGGLAWGTLTFIWHTLEPQTPETPGSIQ